MLQNYILQQEQSPCLKGNHANYGQTQSQNFFLNSKNQVKKAKYHICSQICTAKLMGNCLQPLQNGRK